MHERLSYFAEATSKPLERLAQIYRVTAADRNDAGVLFLQGDDKGDRRPGQLAVFDEVAIEYSDAVSRAREAQSDETIVVIQSLELSHGLAGAPCGAVIGHERLIDRLAVLVEDRALPSAICDAALAALDPLRAICTRERVQAVRRDRAQLANDLAGASGAIDAKEGSGPEIIVRVKDAREALSRLRKYSVEAEYLSDGRICVPVGSREENDRLLAAFGVNARGAPVRSGAAIRETKETRIVATVDLDQQREMRIDTGIGFFDHMLAQIAHHAGISAALACDGDLYVDAHHTIEDCAIAFGEALSEALGDRRGIARFGFLLPMDEAEARISIDLGGRPYLVFDGVFSAPLIGAYPTQMTEHVFRSLAQSLRASIHLSVKGDNDHHKTEACFKAFGRALRDAIRIESDQTPSTKGAIL